MQFKTIIINLNSFFTGKSTRTKSRSLKRAAPAPPKTGESIKGDNRLSDSQLSPQSHGIPNGPCNPTQSRSCDPAQPTQFKEDITVSNRTSHERVRNDSFVFVDKTDCASSPIHIPVKSSDSDKDKVVKQSTVSRTDCATSPIHSPIKSPTVSREISHENQSGLVNVDTIPLPPGLGAGLIEEVRRNTGLSYEKSGVAVETVLGHLGLKIPEIATVLDKVCLTLNEVYIHIILIECSLSIHEFLSVCPQ